MLRTVLLEHPLPPTEAHWRCELADPRGTAPNNPNTLASRIIFPDWNCAILWFPASAGGFNGRAAEIRNPLCRNDPGSTEAQRDRRQAMPGAGMRSRRRNRAG